LTTSNTCSLTAGVSWGQLCEEGAVRVLGVDPGLTRCGLGVVEGTSGQQLTAVAVDVIRTAAGAELGRRLLAIGTALEEWIDRYHPDAVAVERVFAQHNVRTVMGTAQVAGVAIVAATRREIPVVLHTPSEVKAAVTGSGRADKAQVTTMVVRLLRLSERPSPPDAADALALAMCCIWRGSAVERLAGSVSWGGSGTAEASRTAATQARSAT
jgi:crossover junction endodeoxyribonuclease RuvC